MDENSVLASGDRPLPYVYLLTHRETGKFYFGSRHKNVDFGRKSEDDLGFFYKSSSKIVKPHFDEYDAVVLAEFFNTEDAMRFEHQLIKKEWGNPMLINRAVVISDDYVKMINPMKGRKLSAEQKKKIGDGNRGKRVSELTRQKLSSAMKGKSVTWSEGAKIRYKEYRKSTPLSDDHKKSLCVGQRRRFENEDQHESNRRAGAAGYLSRSKKGFKILKVTCAGGRVSVMYASVGVYAKVSGLDKSVIYRAAVNHPDIACTLGRAKGLAFSFVG